MSYHFTILDVFTHKKYAGNQLAVFRHAAALSSVEMQAIAREINFSETTFILSDEPHLGGFDVRIFTPRAEVPFAGHPTLGTAHVIRHELLQGCVDRVVLNLHVGPIPVTFTPDGVSWMKQIEPKFGTIHPAPILAAVLGLEIDDLDERFPIQEVSTGLAFFIVPLKTLSTLKRAKVDLPLYNRLIQDTDAKGILVFCPEPHEPEHDLAVRVFVDYFGVPEDPATGSGNGCLAGYLVKTRYFGDPKVFVKVEQGYEIGRPSLLLLDAFESNGKIGISIGGQSVIVARGELG